MGCFFLKRILRKEQSYCSQNNSDHLLDRLPDDILLHILSFMSTRDCVRSSILGKRWRFLWASVLNLEFHSWDHKTMTSFSNFFNRFVFEHKGHSINSFRLKHYDSMEGSEYKFGIEKLIATAIACNVHVIEIHSRFDFVLPQALFTCKTLVDLTLNCIRVYKVPMDSMTITSVYFPALKKLKLIRIRYESEESLGHLLSGCRALEELTILKEDENVVCVNISSPTLTRLDLKIGFNYHCSDDEYYEVRLDTPALKYLRLHDSLSRDFSTEMLASLTEADIFLDCHPYLLDVHPHTIKEFVGKLNNVSCLKLNTFWMVYHSAFSALTTEFRNLTKLQLEGDWRFVTNFLEISDNLEFLTIGEIKEFGNGMEPKQVPVCLIYHLGKVRFESFKCSETEFSMVEYILRNAKVLKTMDIMCASYWQHYLKKKSEAHKRITLFERASEACELAFH